MTTRFGYFAGLFNGERKASGGINFSMWAASAHSEKAPALSDMPHLIATGNSLAEFSGFGHEGSGVKIRNWSPLAHQPDSIIQALRVEQLPIIEAAIIAISIIVVRSVGYSMLWGKR